MEKIIICENCNGEFEEDNLILVQDGRVCIKHEGKHFHDKVWLEACPKCRTDNFLRDVKKCSCGKPMFLEACLSMGDHYVCDGGHEAIMEDE